MLCPSGTLGMMRRAIALEAWNNSDAVSRAFIVFMGVLHIGEAFPVVSAGQGGYRSDCRNALRTPYPEIRKVHVDHYISQ
jgi:hypothetical protein